MNYHRLDNRRKKTNNQDLLQGGVIVIVLIIIFYIFRGPLTNLFHGVQGSISSFFMPSGAIVRSTDDKALIESLEADTTQLKILLGKKLDTDKSVLASIIVRPPQTPYDTIIVDAGQNESIHVGDVVYGEAEYAIGKVTEIYAKTSLVTLFSSSGEKEDVLVGTSSSSTMAVAEGRGGGNFYIKLPKNAEVSLNAPILWPDSDIVLLGTVEKIDNENGSTYAYIYFKSPINIQSLRYVQIKTALH